MRDKPSAALALLMMAASAYAALAALSWPLKTALFPLVISVPVFLMAATELGLGVLGKQAAVEGEAPPARRRIALAAGWIGGLFAAIVLLGFPVAVPLFVFLYLKIESRERWLFSVIFSIVVSAIFYALFELALHIPFPTGFLWRIG